MTEPGAISRSDGQSGATLIEVVVALAIVALTLAVAAGGLRLLARSGERGKLSWTSPFSGRCLFVNRNGLRVDEIAPERLARDIEQGITRILERTRLLQRSLQGLLDQLRAARGAESHSA